MIAFLSLGAAIGAFSWALGVWVLLLAVTSLAGALGWLPWALLAAWLGAVGYYRLQALGHLHRPTNRCR